MRGTPTCGSSEPPSRSRAPRARAAGAGRGALPSGGPGRGPRVEERGLEVTVVSRWPRRYPIVGAWLAAGRPDVVHLHWIHDFLGGSKGVPTARNVRWFDWQLRVLRARGVRIVWTAHNLKAHEAGDDGRAADAHPRLIERCDAGVLPCGV